MNGDDMFVASVREVYAWDHDRLWRAVHAFSGSRPVTDDAVAEAFARAIRDGDAIRDVTNTVWRSAFAIARVELARRRIEPPLSEQASATEPAGDGDLLTMRSHLDALDDQDRQLLAWSHVGGWSAKEMAPALGMRAVTVQLKLHRAGRRVDAQLGDRAQRNFESFGRVRVPDQWDEIVARADTDDLSAVSGRQRRRPVIVVAGLTAVVALVGAFVVVVTGSPAADDEPPVADEERGPATAIIGDGREVTLAINDVDTGEVTGTFRLRLYEAGGATLLEYEDVDVEAGDDVEFLVVEVDGRPELRTPHEPRSIGAIAMSDGGTLTEPFTLRIALTGAAGEVIQASETVLLTPAR